MFIMGAGFPGGESEFFYDLDLKPKRTRSFVGLFFSLFDVCENLRSFVTC